MATSYYDVLIEIRDGINDLVGGGGGGEVTSEQLHTDLETLNGYIGADDDGPATAGGIGSLSAKMRLLTTQLAGATPAGTNNIGSVTLAPGTSGGLSVYRSLDQGVTGGVVKASAGQMYGYYLYNGGSATRFVKIYDKATAATQADTPILTLPLPAGAAANVSHPNGVAFAAGIGVRASTGVADNDTGAPGTNEVCVNIYFK